MAPDAAAPPPKPRRTFATLRKRGNNFSGRYVIGGKVYEEALGTSDRKEAEAKLAVIQYRLGKGDYVLPEVRKQSFNDLCELVLTDYRTHKRSSLRRVESALVHLKAFFGATRPSAITKERIRRYEATRVLEEGAAQATANYELTILRRAFNLGNVPNAPKITITNPHNARKGFFEDATFYVVHEHLFEHWKNPMLFAKITGWRTRSEILSLRWTQIDTRAGVIRLEPGETKNREGRNIKYAQHPVLKRIFEEQEARAKACVKQHGRYPETVFFFDDGSPLLDYRKAWRTAIDLAAHGGVPRGKGKDLRAVTNPDLLKKRPLVHDLRRTAARNFERAGVPRAVAMTIGGWRTEAMYARYAITNESDTGDGLAKVAALSGDAASVERESGQKMSPEQGQNRDNTGTSALGRRVARRA